MGKSEKIKRAKLKKLEKENAVTNELKIIVKNNMLMLSVNPHYYTKTHYFDYDKQELTADSKTIYVDSKFGHAYIYSAIPNISDIPIYIRLMDFVWIVQPQI